jgi:hypothetical protein
MMKIEDQPSEFWEMIDAAFFFKPPIEGGIYGTSPPKQ